ncbi:Zinc finger mym-type protein 1 [Plakobranchus ocellatus]|uniref:Zinc finger mym-type protein 1 n=1 Tax=Plakobranchus ocellatus TaxID=259542 RepID=A0AAV3YN67_9GAST|nr:Zinc finger mym-type protein 1 [Plakobranchus ocellatus]
MLVEVLNQVNKHIPPAKDVFKNLSYLNPACVLSQTSKANVVDLPFQHLITSAIEEQYRKVNFVNWLEEKAFQKTGIPQDSEQFWFGVLGHPSFKDISTYALTCLATPVSNAVVERVFSLVNAVKTKPRNRLQTDLLDAIVRIRSNLILNGKCCQDFSASAAMISAHTSENLYMSQSQQNVLVPSTSASEPELLSSSQQDCTEDEDAALLLLDI